MALFGDVGRFFQRNVIDPIDDVLDHEIKFSSKKLGIERVDVTVGEVLGAAAVVGGGFALYNAGLAAGAATVAGASSAGSGLAIAAGTSAAGAAAKGALTSAGSAVAVAGASRALAQAPVAAPIASTAGSLVGAALVAGATQVGQKVIETTADRIANGVAGREAETETVVSAPGSDNTMLILGAAALLLVAVMAR